MSGSSVDEAEAIGSERISGRPRMSLLALGVVPRGGRALSLIVTLWLLVTWAL
jgi:hypothetical protein